MAMTRPPSNQYEVFVSKDDFKFNAAHFMAYPGFRERLHGHNYRIAVRVLGALDTDGYVVDFGDIKKAARAVCEQMNERVIVPMRSDVLNIVRKGGQIEVTCEDESFFSFPEADCVALPIVHTSAEELAAYVCGELVSRLEVLRSRAVSAIEVTVAEAPSQEARYRIAL